jgi:hypothetical protein
LECFSPGGDRNVALLTRDVAERSGNLSLGVRFGQLGTRPLERGFVGFRIGIKHQMSDYRATAIYGRGMNAGVNADGRLFIGKIEAAAPKVDLANEMQLQLHARPSATGYTIVLRATNIQEGYAAETTREVPNEWLTGGLALVCSAGATRQFRNCERPSRRTSAETSTWARPRIMASRSFAMEFIPFAPRRCRTSSRGVGIRQSRHRTRCLDSAIRVIILTPLGIG